MQALVVFFHACLHVPKQKHFFLVTKVKSIAEKFEDFANVIWNLNGLILIFAIARVVCSLCLELLSGYKCLLR